MSYHHKLIQTSKHLVPCETYIVDLDGKQQVVVQACTSAAVGPKQGVE